MKFRNFSEAGKMFTNAINMQEEDHDPIYYCERANFYIELS